jgi:hypothetical protein
MIARLTRAVVFRQILLAALLKLCNAAETFFRDQRKILWDRAGKRGFDSFGSPNESRIRRRIAPAVESPAAT